MTGCYLTINLLLTVFFTLGGWKWFQVNNLGESSVTIERKPNGRGVILASLPILLLVGGTHIYLGLHPRAAWDLPIWLELHYSEVAWGTIISIFSFVFSFTVAAHFKSAHPQRRTLLIASIGLIFSLLVYSTSMSRHRPPKLGKEIPSYDGSILQTSSSTCVPAAAANILASFGVQATERELMECFRTSEDGTQPAQAIVGLGKLGFKVTKKTVHPSNISAIQPPAILLVSEEQHAIAYFGITNGVLHAIDPMSGRRNFRVDIFTNLWGGRALEVRRE